MKFTECPVEGAYVIEVQRIGDERGYFGRLWCQNEYRDMGLVSEIRQSNIGYSKCAGTTRGLHYQKKPYEEVKIVSCVKGAIFDVVLDLRPDSETYLQWFGVELNEENTKMLYVPEGCATGYQTLVDDTVMQYLATEFYVPDCATGVRFDDPAFGIEWPRQAIVVSDKDQNWPDYRITK